MADSRLKLVGATGSPYTHKMLSLMRYRHIPYQIIWGQADVVCEQLGIEPPKPVLLPTYLFEEQGKTVAATDSTPIIRRLESMYDERSVIPSDAALAFIDYLIEDFGDEWCTRFMFHYRWHFADDADNAGTMLPLGFDVTMPDEQLNALKSFFSERQIGRLWVVGSNESTAPVIDASYRRFLSAMQAHLANQPYILGERPAAGDFAIYGQLTQLIGFDPTPRSIAYQESPRTVGWVDRLEDLSGLEVAEHQWTPLEDQPDTLKSILNEIGRVYAPTQIANAKAVAEGEKTWQCTVDGEVWSQKTFPYQAKCLQWLNERYQQLTDNDRKRVDALLKDTGIEAMLSL